MRRIFSITFALIVLNGAHAAGQTVDEIVAKNLRAKGGAEKWQAIKSVKMTGKMTAQGTEMPLTVYAMRPNFNRQEITMPAGKAVQAFDGTTAWVINPMLGIDTPRAVPGPAADSASHSADFDGALINYKEKGNTIEFVGTEKLAGSKDVYHLKVTTKGGVVQHYYLDSDNGIELKMSAEVERGGQKHTVNTEMSDYRPIDGILIPHTVTQTADGHTLLTWTISKVEFNAVTDDSIFRMPRK